MNGLLITIGSTNDLCTAGLSKLACYHAFMKADLRISIKDYRRGKNLKVLLYRVPFGTHKFWVRMNGPAWPQGRRSNFGD
jgi:hypothetical protein